MDQWKSYSSRSRMNNTVSCPDHCKENECKSSFFSSTYWMGNFTVVSIFSRVFDWKPKDEQYWLYLKRFKWMIRIGGRRQIEIFFSAWICSLQCGQNHLSSGPKTSGSMNVCKHWASVMSWSVIEKRNSTVKSTWPVTTNQSSTRWWHCHRRSDRWFHCDAWMSSRVEALRAYYR